MSKFARFNKKQLITTLNNIIQRVIETAATRRNNRPQHTISCCCRSVVNSCFPDGEAVKKEFVLSCEMLFPKYPRYKSYFVSKNRQDINLMLFQRIIKRK